MPAAPSEDTTASQPPLSDDEVTQRQISASDQARARKYVPQASSAKAQDGPARPFLPGYEILGELGRGGMGVVYKARQCGLGRLVALKMILAGGHAGDEERKRFRIEAEAMARLQHPNIVQVHEVGDFQGHSFFSLELCSGGSLAQKLAGTLLAPPQAAELVESLARAMQAAHEKKVIHRDLKPANVLLTEDGTPKITDFGLARKIDEAGQTASGSIMGTPSYMAPEQADGKIRELGPPCDIYALGAILYECLTGRPPFKAATLLDTVMQVVNEEPVPPRQLNPQVPRDLQTICLKCLSKEPSRRYASGLELADDLRRVLEDEPIHARPVGPVERLLKMARRSPKLTALYTTCALTLAALLVLGFWFSAEMGSARGKLEAEAERTAAAERARQEESARTAAAHKLAETERFFGLQRAVERRSVRAEPGWTWANLADVEKAARLAPAGAHRTELRSEAAAALGSIDLRPCGSVAPGFCADCLAFAPQGRLLALGQAKAWPPLPCAVRLIDLNGKTRERTLSFQPQVVWGDAGLVQDGVRALTFSPDGRWLVAGSRSGWIHLWDLAQDAPTAVSWPALKQNLVHLRFSRDGTSLFSAGDQEAVVQRWSLPVGPARPRKPRPHQVYTTGGRIRTLDIHPSEGWLCCGSVDNKAHFLDAHTLQPLRRPLELPADHWRFSPDGSWLIVAWGTELRLVKPETGEVAQRVGEGAGARRGQTWIDHLSVSPWGMLLACSSNETQHLRVWGEAGDRLLADLFVGDGSLRSAFAPDGRLLALAGQDQTRLFEVSSRGVQTFAAAGPQPVLACALHADGRSLATLVPSWPDLRWHHVLVWPTAEGAMRSIQHSSVADLKPGTTPLLAFQPNSQTLAHSSRKGVALRDSAGRTKPRELPVEKQNALDCGPDGSVWIASGDELHVWEGRTDQARRHWKNALSETLTGKSQLRALTVGHRWVVVGGWDGQVHLFKAAGGSRNAGMAAFQRGVRSLALSGSEGMLAAGSESGEVSVFRIPDGAVVAQLPPHEDQVRALSWSGDRLFASGSRDGVVKLWRVNAGKVEELLRLSHPLAVSWLKLHPDGVRLFVLLEGERAVRVWHLDRLRARLEKMGLGAGLEVIEARPLPPAAPQAAADPPRTEAPRGPNGLKAELFADADLRCCVKVRCDPRIDFDWTKGPLDPLLPQEGFSVRWTGWLKPPRAGRYTLRLESDDGARLWLGGKLLIDQWRIYRGQPDHHQVMVDLNDQPQPLRVEFYQAYGPAFIHLRWAQEGGFAMQPVPTANLFLQR